MTLALKGKKKKKCKNSTDLKYRIAKIWKIRKVKVMLLVISALGTLTKNFEKWIEKLDSDLMIEALQKPCLLGTAGIIR